MDVKFLYLSGKKKMNLFYRWVMME